MSEKVVSVDALRRLTPARLRLEAGAGAARLSSVLDFQRCHATARDAIHVPVDWDGLTEAVGQGDGPVPIRVHSQAEGREVYLRRADLGRRLRDADRAALPAGPFDLVIVLADGLSARAVDAGGAALVAALREAFADLSLGPVVLAEQARVGLGDDIGAAMGAELVLVLIGERPGLSVTSSLGAYLTRNPQVGTPDSARNCVSNIHDHGGLSIPEAVHKINWLVRYARRLGMTGVGLKDESDTRPLLD